MIQKTFSQKQLLLLAVVCGIVALFLVSIIFAVSKQFLPQTSPTAQTVKTAYIFFDPSPLLLGNSSGSSETFQLWVDAGDSSVTGAQVELLFNPTELLNVTVSPPAENMFFGAQADFLILSQEVDQKAGKILYSIGLKPNIVAKGGKGVFGIVTFIPSKTFPASTIITPGPKTIVTKDGQTESVLKSVTPLTIVKSI